MTSEKTEKPDLGEALFVFCLSVPVHLWASFVLTKLWEWFVVPFGVGPIGMWHAAGLLTMIGMIRYRVGGRAPKMQDSAELALVALLALGIGALYHGFMS